MIPYSCCRMLLCKVMTTGPWGQTPCASVLRVLASESLRQSHQHCQEGQESQKTGGKHVSPRDTPGQKCSLFELQQPPLAGCVQDLQGESSRTRVGPWWVGATWDRGNRRRRRKEGAVAVREGVPGWRKCTWGWRPSAPVRPEASPI